MKDLLGHEWLWYPLSFLGLKSQFFSINADTVIATWIAMAILAILIFICRYLFADSDSVGGYIAHSIVKNFIELIEQSVGTFIYRYFTFISSLFIFIMACNYVALIPGIEEPTKNINTTLALGVISFLYAQKEIIKIHGIKAYLKEYFMPFSFIFPLNLLAGLAVLPLKLLGELASVISISFRLFGNIFGGSIIMGIYQQAISGSIMLNIIGLFGINLIITGFFILFEGFLQAFVFSILSLTNIAMAVQENNEDTNT